MTNKLDKLLETFKLVVDGKDVPRPAGNFTTYAITNFRGGIGKSTLAFNLAWECQVPTSTQSVGHDLSRKAPYGNIPANLAEANRDFKRERNPKRGHYPLRRPKSPHPTPRSSSHRKPPSPTRTGPSPREPAERTTGFRATNFAAASSPDALRTSGTKALPQSSAKVPEPAEFFQARCTATSPQHPAAFRNSSSRFPCEQFTPNPHKAEECRWENGD